MVILIDVLGQLIGPIFKDHEYNDFPAFLNFGDKAGRWSRNVRKELPLLAA